LPAERAVAFHAMRDRQHAAAAGNLGQRAEGGKRAVLNLEPFADRERTGPFQRRLCGADGEHGYRRNDPLERRGVVPCGERAMNALRLGRGRAPRVADDGRAIDDRDIDVASPQRGIEVQRDIGGNRAFPLCHEDEHRARDRRGSGRGADPRELEAYRGLLQLRDHDCVFGCAGRVQRAADRGHVLRGAASPGSQNQRVLRAQRLAHERGGRLIELRLPLVDDPDLGRAVPVEVHLSSRSRAAAPAARMRTHRRAG
jgi:hypothetical protein